MKTLVTIENQSNVNTFYVVSLKYKNGRGNLECRRNGKTKTWKRNPEKFQIPVKYGLYEYFYITNENAHEFSITNPSI